MSVVTPGGTFLVEEISTSCCLKVSSLMQLYLSLVPFSANNTLTSLPRFSIEISIAT